MARTFDGATTRLATTTTPVTAVPFTLAAWARPDDTISDSILGLRDTSASNDRFYIAHGVGTNPSRAVVGWIVGASPSTIETTTSLANNTWGHICGVFASSTSRTVYLNGGGSASSGASSSPSAFETIQIGANGVGLGLFQGLIAEAAIWNAALTAAEVAILAKGFCPLLVRPESLVFYAPLLGNDSPELDLSGGLSINVTGSPAKAAHPRVYMPAYPLYVPFAPSNWLLVKN